MEWLTFMRINDNNGTENNNKATISPQPSRSFSCNNNQTRKQLLRSQHAQRLENKSSQAMQRASMIIIIIITHATRSKQATIKSEEEQSE